MIGDIEVIVEKLIIVLSCYIVVIDDSSVGSERSIEVLVNIRLWNIYYLLLSFIRLSPVALRILEVMGVVITHDYLRHLLGLLDISQGRGSKEGII